MIGLLLLGPPVVVFGLLLVGFSHDKHSRRPLWALFPLVTPLALLWLGDAYAFGHDSGVPVNEWTRSLLAYLFLGQIAAYIGLVIWMNGQRWLASSGAAFGLWATFWAYFIAALEVNGDGF